MNCPACGKKMEEGKITTDYSRGLFFLPPGGKIGFIASRKGIEKQNGVVLDGPYNTNLPNETEIPACICRDCPKIIVEY